MVHHRADPFSQIDRKVCSLVALKLEMDNSATLEKPLLKQHLLMRYVEVLLLAARIRVCDGYFWRNRLRLLTVSVDGRLAKELSEQIMLSCEQSAIAICTMTMLTEEVLPAMRLQSFAGS